MLTGFIVNEADNANEVARGNINKLVSNNINNINITT
jgi:hypothetical protein